MAESSSIVERIKQKLDIVDEIGAVVPLRKSGKAFKGLCPFHGERTPSFYVYPEGWYRCFGCGENGDIFTFVEKQQGVDFREALALLAERAGIALESGAREGEAHQESPEAAARKRLRALNEAAAIWLHHQLLQSPEARYARTYLDSRGVNGESITLWRLGYAPEGDRLSRYLQEQGYTAKELIEAGIARERDAGKGGGLYDTFRNRLIFPIRDARGQTIAFGGRELGGGHPKYLNTPQTLIFDKSATLYGLDLAREGIRRAGQVVIVEGYMDALVTHQYGFRNVVACIGSAITDKHIKQIKKLTRRVALALDPDAAGEAAMVRGITVAQQAFDRISVPTFEPSVRSEGRDRTKRQGILRFEQQVDATITVVLLPPHEDPDEVVRRDPSVWQRAIEQAQPLINFLIDSQTADLDLRTYQGKVEAMRRLLPLIAEVTDQKQAEVYGDELAHKLRMEPSVLQRELRETQRRLRQERQSRVTSQRTAEQGGGAEDQTGASVERLGEKYSESGRASPSPSYSATGTYPIVTGPDVRLRMLVRREEECLGLLLTYPVVWPEVYGIVAEGDFAGTETRALYRAAAAALGADAFDLPRLRDGLPSPLQEAAARALAMVATDEPLDGQGLIKAARDAAYRLKRVRIEEEMAELDYLQRDAEQSGDGEALRALLRRKQQLLSQRRALDAASGLHG